MYLVRTTTSTMNKLISEQQRIRWIVSYLTLRSNSYTHFVCNTNCRRQRRQQRQRQPTAQKYLPTTTSCTIVNTNSSQFNTRNRCHLLHHHLRRLHYFFSSCRCIDDCFMNGNFLLCYSTGNRTTTAGTLRCTTTTITNTDTFVNRIPVLQQRQQLQCFNHRYHNHHQHRRRQLQLPIFRSMTTKATPNNNNQTTNDQNRPNEQGQQQNDQQQQQQLEEQLRQQRNAIKEEQQIIRSTQKWIETVVIHEQLCPFVVAAEEGPVVTTTTTTTHDDVATEAHLSTRSNSNDNDIEIEDGGGHKPEYTTKFVIKNHVQLPKDTTNIATTTMQNIRYVVSNAMTIEQFVADVAKEAKALLYQPGHTISFKRPKRLPLFDEMDGLLIHDTNSNKSGTGKKRINTTNKSSTTNDSNTTTTTPTKYNCTLIMINQPFVYHFNDFDHVADKIYEKVMVDDKYRYFDLLHFLYFHPEHIDYIELRPEYLKIDDSFFFPKRSPYPTILLLKYQDVEHIYHTVEHVHELTPTNKMNFVNQGLYRCEKRLLQCYFHDTDNDDKVHHNTNNKSTSTTTNHDNGAETSNTNNKSITSTANHGDGTATP